MAVDSKITELMLEIPDHRVREDLRQILESILADLTALRTSFTTLTAKLDADAGVTDVNYATTCNPAALKLKA